MDRIHRINKNKQQTRIGFGLVVFDLIL